jgi:hypothetical protein
MTHWKPNHHRHHNEQQQRTSSIEGEKLPLFYFLSVLFIILCDSDFRLLSVPSFPSSLIYSLIVWCNYETTGRRGEEREPATLEQKKRNFYEFQLIHSRRLRPFFNSDGRLNGKLSLKGGQHVLVKFFFRWFFTSSLPSASKLSLHSVFL